MNEIEAISAITIELRRAIEKFPSWPDDVVHASAIVAEEAGELSRAALQVTYEGGTFEAVEEEAIQVGAMALRLLINNTVVRPSPQTSHTQETPDE